MGLLRRPTTRPARNQTSVVRAPGCLGQLGCPVRARQVGNCGLESTPDDVCCQSVPALPRRARQPCCERLNSNPGTIVHWKIWPEIARTSCTAVPPEIVPHRRTLQVHVAACSALVLHCRFGRAQWEKPRPATMFENRPVCCELARAQKQGSSAYWGLAIVHDSLECYAVQKSCTASQECGIPVYVQLMHSYGGPVQETPMSVQCEASPRSRMLCQPSTDNSGTEQELRSSLLCQ